MLAHRTREIMNNVLDYVNGEVSKAEQDLHNLTIISKQFQNLHSLNCDIDDLQKHIEQIISNNNITIPN